MPKKPIAKKKKIKPPVATLPLVPDRIYRWKEVVANRYFGYSDTNLAMLIARGEIPAPVRLSSGGRAVGWTGRTILKFQNDLETGRRRTEAA
jgi:predicted DNA-binding transcriptional regulator AlpA